MLGNIVDLLLLILLQAVLGFDNLLYISIESKRVAQEKQKYVRNMGIGIAIVLRIILLFVLVMLFKYIEKPLFSVHTSFFSGSFKFENIIVLFGGAFIIYTAIKEIWHMMNFDPNEEGDKQKSSPRKIISLIVFMNLIFSFDSILSARAITQNNYIISTAIIISGIMMMLLAGVVSEFLQKNRMYEVLGLFVLFVVGIMLLTEGAHGAHLEIAGTHIDKMSKTTFYFVISIMIIIDVVQGKYQKNLMKKKNKH